MPAQSPENDAHTVHLLPLDRLSDVAGPLRGSDDPGHRPEGPSQGG